MKQIEPTLAQNLVNAFWDALNGRSGLSISDTVQDPEREQEIYAELLGKAESVLLDNVPYPAPSCLYDDDGEFLGYPDALSF